MAEILKISETEVKIGTDDGKVVTVKTASLILSKELLPLRSLARTLTVPRVSTNTSLCGSATFSSVA